MRFLGIDLDLLTPRRAPRPRQRATASGMERRARDTRILLLDLLHEVHRQWCDRARNLPMGALSLGTGHPGELSEPAALDGYEVEEVAAAHLEHGERVADLAALKLAERTALYLQALGYRYREIGAVTDAGYTAVSRRLTEGRAQLRRIARERDSQPPI
jgi:DNA-directed RNA polymerase specialized sigma24 family protein